MATRGKKAEVGGNVLVAVAEAGGGGWQRRLAAARV